MPAWAVIGVESWKVIRWQRRDRFTATRYFLHPVADCSRIPIKHQSRRSCVRPCIYCATQASANARLAFSPAEWRRLRSVRVHRFPARLGLGLYLHYAVQSPQLVGLGFAAYMFGLRHAFDADHIAAVDDTCASCCRRGSSLGGGLFLFPGHATVCWPGDRRRLGRRRRQKRITDAEGFRSRNRRRRVRTFLWIIGVLNLLVLLDILKIWNSADRARIATHTSTRY